MGLFGWVVELLPLSLVACRLPVAAAVEDLLVCLFLLLLGEEVGLGAHDCAGFFSPLLPVFLAVKLVSASDDLGLC